MNDSPSGDLNYLWVLLHQARDAIFKLREKELRKLGISPQNAEILFTIEAIGYKATPTAISRYLLREFHSVSSILSRMEKRGLVKKSNDLGRKNVVRVCLTEKGQQIYHEAIKREAILKILSGLSETEAQQLASSLKKLRDGALKGLGIEDRANLLGY